MSSIFAMESQPGIGPVLRIMNDAAWDPFTTDPSEIGKMQFDSRHGTKLSYVYDIYLQSYDSRYNAGGSNRYYGFDNHDFDTVVSTSFSALADRSAGIIWGQSGSGSQQVQLYKEWWNFGFMPIVEIRSRFNQLPGHFDGAHVQYEVPDGIGGGYGNVTSGSANSIGTSIQIFPDMTSKECYSYITKTATSGTHIDYLLSVFQLPLHNDPIPDNSTTVIGGQEVLCILPTKARLALPGRDVYDTNPENYIFHEDKIPAKIMRAGDVNVAGSGTADIICPLPLTPYTYMDFMVKKQADPEFWHPPYFNGVASNGDYAFNYEVKSDRITITNLTSTAITVRFVIHADSEAGYTTGGSKVLVVEPTYVQLKRPGSSDTAPSMNDIIVDTRLAYMPILAEGYLPWNSTGFPTVITGSNRFKGERMATVSIPNPDPKLKLFIKSAVLFDLRAENPAVGGYHRVFADNTGSWIGRASCDSSWANVHADETAVDFYMSGDNPRFVDSGGASYMTKFRPNDTPVNTPALGLRYYVFGIPQSL
ncbi:hypothetical protein NKJ88_06095 [Mesorhizobium sp. M0016]|uniref:hypothetical protein n=1 Tax=Mesorhizobium sp. M0016 TaxID=2956843 RepID=UPI00333DF8E8